jgi:ABC-type nitrate/sulfonate/bicarbonate transport system permease component
MARALTETQPTAVDVAPPTASRRPPWLRLGFSLLALLALWQLTAAAAADPRLMPGPVPVMARLWQELMAGELLLHLGATLARVVASFVIAAG